ncbi:MAG TPA: hypothetical protein VFX35_11540 [Solirubrobacterales bacterium]|nr:hypothetical protein [Solirubrobacterales bacterium]
MIPMGMKLEDPVQVTRDNGGKRRHVKVSLSQLAFDSLIDAEAGFTVQAPIRMESALRIYLADKGSGRPAWPYPRFLQGSETQADVQVDFAVEADLWREFEEEASSQGVSVEKLAEHAAFYFAAEASAGRLTQRILADLEPGNGD